MTLREKIQCMEAFERGEYVEVRTDKTKSGTWSAVIDPLWDWNNNDYRIRPKPKQVVVIEKWLIYDKFTKSYSIAEESNIEEFLKDDKTYLSKVKLLDTYEVEI